MGSIITLSIVQSALELGFIYALVALALFVSFSINRRLFHVGLCGLCDSDACRTSGVRIVCCSRSRCAVWICYRIFTDQNGHSVNLSRNYCKYRTVYDQYCSHGVCIQSQSFFLRYGIFMGERPHRRNLV